MSRLTNSNIDEFGKTVFLTKAEAKANLKELRGEDNDRISKN